MKTNPTIPQDKRSYPVAQRWVAIETAKRLKGMTE